MKHRLVHIENSPTVYIYRENIGIFPIPRAYIQGQISDSTDIFPNMTSSKGREGWGEGRFSEIFDPGVGVQAKETTCI